MRTWKRKERRKKGSFHKLEYLLSRLKTTIKISRTSEQQRFFTCKKINFAQTLRFFLSRQQSMFSVQWYFPIQASHSKKKPFRIGLHRRRRFLEGNFNQTVGQSSNVRAICLRLLTLGRSPVVLKTGLTSRYDCFHANSHTFKLKELDQTLTLKLDDNSRLW